MFVMDLIITILVTRNGRLARGYDYIFIIF